MTKFRRGTVQRDKVPRVLRRFSPTEALHSLDDIDAAELWKSGKRLLLLDVDNTLLPWKSRDIPASTRAWLDKAKQLGFEFCVLSNTRHPERLKAICQDLGLSYLRAKWKPSREMYLRALEQYGRTPAEAVMVGDQLLTDIWGANRCDVDAIWVRPMSNREFIGTRYISRNVERFIGLFLYRYFQTDVVDAEGRPGFFRHEMFSQVMKFAVVGASSFVIDSGVLFLLMFYISIGGHPLGEVFGSWLSGSLPAVFGHASKVSDPAVPFFKIPSTCLAILNGFYWNLRWTFSHADRSEKGPMLKRYFAVSLVGLVMSTGFTTLFNHLIHGQAQKSLLAANVFAAVLVAMWNFVGSRTFVFIKKK